MAAHNQPRVTVAVLLSGCGLHDGTEVHEAAFTALSLATLGAKIVYCAPNVALAHVVDHQHGDLLAADSRNALIESARIARAPVVSLDKIQPEQLAMLVIPGGYGAIKTLCNYALVGRQAKVDRGVSALIEAVADRGRPIVGYCVSTILLARVLGSRGVRVGLGWDPQIDADCVSWGARVERCAADRITVDHDQRVLTTPAFSATQDIVTVARSIEQVLKAAMSWR